MINNRSVLIAVGFDDKKWPVLVLSVTMMIFLQVCPIDFMSIASVFNVCHPIPLLPATKIALRIRSPFGQKVTVAGKQCRQAVKQTIVKGIEGPLFLRHSIICFHSTN